MQRRRPLLLTGLAAAAWPLGARALQGGSPADALRLGVDLALVQSGLASALQRAFAADTGVAVRPVPLPALPLLEALDRGEVDAALCNAPQAEEKLEQQGLVHDRREVARGGFVLVGPAVKGRLRDAGVLAGARSVAEALARIAAAAPSRPDALAFVSAGDGSGTHVAEQAAWRAARVAPAAPWYTSAAPGKDLVAQVQARAAYALVERGVWAAAGGAGLAVVVAADPLAAERVHVMRGFRVNHPAGKIFVAWVSGPMGRRVVAGLRAYTAPA